MTPINTIIAKEIKDQVSLVDILARLGFEPCSRSGNEYIYQSMIRDPDNKPSFYVNDKLGVWYDHGISKGGNIIDFGLAFWRNLPFADVLEKIVQLSDTGTIQPNDTTRNNLRRRRAVKIPNYEVKEIKDLGNNVAITEYLQNRGVWQAAQGRLKEVYYYVEDHKKLRKPFFAAGWQNEMGAWEVRNFYFNGCLGHKAITFIPGDKHTLSVFEGYINYLSWLTENPCSKDSVLVINTASLLHAATRTAQEYKKVALFFDRDQLGHLASLEFLKAVPFASDCSEQYIGYNDYNDKIRADFRNPVLLR